jgi:hypothetical protein
VKHDLQARIDGLFREAYQEGELDDEYQATFAEEGYRKAQYIIDDLHYREARGQLSTNDLGYLCIGGADGSEVKQVLTGTDISLAVMIEISDRAVQRAAVIATELAEKRKTLVVLQGDVTARLDDGLKVLEDCCATGKISGLVCSAQGVLHELPRRSPGYDLATFLGKLFRGSGWKTGLFYSREPCTPTGWPNEVRLRIPTLEAKQLARAAEYVRDRLGMSGRPEVLASNWVQLPAMLAIETLHKLIRGGSIKRIGYELGEQLTGFDALAVKRHLQSYIENMRVDVEQITTIGFKEALQEYEVEYVGHGSECLPVPRTHSEIVGFFTVDDRSSIPSAEPELIFEPPAEPPTAITQTAFTNPFRGDVSDERIANWLVQFEPDEQPLIAKLLERFTYISLEQLRPLARDLHSRVREILLEIGSDTWFVPLGGIAKSGGLISYFYRVANQIPATQFTDYAGLASQQNLEDKTLVLLDDLLGTGHQAVHEYNLLKELSDIPASCKIILATLVGGETGIRYITERTDLTPCSAIQVTRYDDPLDPAFDLFDVDDLSRVRTILRKYGERLAPGSPFGYAGSALLVAFAHSTPDNTLPIFWSNKDGWLPLLQRGGSSRIGGIF